MIERHGFFVVCVYVNTNRQTVMASGNAPEINQNEIGKRLASQHRDIELIKWLEKRLAKSLPLDEYQWDKLIDLLCSLRALEVKQ